MRSARWSQRACTHESAKLLTSPLQHQPSHPLLPLAPTPPLPPPPLPRRLPPIPLFAHFASPDFLSRPALVFRTRQCHSHLRRSPRRYALRAVAAAETARSIGSAGSALAILQPGGFDFCAVLFGCWLSGAIAVPLQPRHSPPEIEYILGDSGAAALIVGEEYAANVAGVKRTTPAQNGSSSEMQVLQWGGDAASASATAAGTSTATTPHPVPYGSPASYLSRRALLIYTSGTTGSPKGVVWSHSMLEYQLRTLTALWGWSSADRILNVLPLHHVHGLINVMMCAMYAGAACVFPPHAKAGAAEIAQMLMDEQRGINVFMAVPTIYSRILAWLDTQPASVRDAFKSSVSSRFRLMVSGSSAAPLPVLQGWKQASGIDLLERYGMSEAGMILSQPLDPARRVPGTVGQPLPGVKTKIEPRPEDEESGSTAAAAAAAAASSSAGDVVGDLLIQGPGVFREYWNRPARTAAEFDSDGWFKTGDVVSVTAASASSPAVFRMLGRSSVDVLKSGGYKISALDVERELLSHPEITEAAVVGLPDEQYGQVVAAIVVMKPASACSSASLSAWCRSRLASYQIPRVWRIVNEIPKNAMGKTNKKHLIRSFAAEKQVDTKA